MKWDTNLGEMNIGTHRRGLNHIMPETGPLLPLFRQGSLELDFYTDRPARDMALREITSRAR